MLLSKKSPFQRLFWPVRFGGEMASDTSLSWFFRKKFECRFDVIHHQSRSFLRVSPHGILVISRVWH